MGRRTGSTLAPRNNGGPAPGHVAQPPQDAAHAAHVVLQSGATHRSRPSRAAPICALEVYTSPQHLFSAEAPVKIKGARRAESRWHSREQYAPMPTLRAVTYASVTVSLYARLVAAAISPEPCRYSALPAAHVRQPPAHLAGPHHAVGEPAPAGADISKSSRRGTGT